MQFNGDCVGGFQCLSENNGHDAAILLRDGKISGYFGGDGNGYAMELMDKALSAGRMGQEGQHPRKKHHIVSLKTQKGEDKYLCKFMDVRPAENDCSLLLMRKVSRCYENRDKYLAAMHLLDRMDEGVIVTDRKGKIIHANDSFESSTGYTLDEIKNRRTHFLRSHPHDREHFKGMTRTVINGGIWRGMISKKAKDGSFLEVSSEIIPLFDADSKISGFVSIMKKTGQGDASVLAALFQSQKFELAGKLAAGALHNVNNLLNIISLGCELLKQQLPADSSSNELVEKIQSAEKLSASLIIQIMNLLKEKKSEPDVTGINEKIKDVAELFKIALSKEIRLEMELSESELFVKLVPSHLEQIMLNILLNARDSIGGRGAITISSGEEEYKKEVRLNSGTVKPGRYALIRIRNDGRPIDEKDMDRIFEAFYSTKKDKGTGLGLFTVFEQVRHNNGFVDISSSEKEGTEFRIILPVVDFKIDR